MFKPDRINIHELTIEEPEKPSEMPFDPERDITEEDWKGMRGELEEARQEKKWNIFLPRAMEMKILDPNQDLNLDKIAWQGMKDGLESCRRVNDWGDFSWRAMRMKILGSRQDLINQTDWQAISYRLEEERKINSNISVDDFSWQAMRIKILNPHLNLNLSQAAWQRMKDELEQSRRSNNWGDFYWRAMKMKILDPKQNLDLDQTAWQGMKDQLEGFRKANNSWAYFSRQAMAMKILAAEEVKVTDKGLEIKMREDRPLTSTTPPLPETKKF